jgi:hypothetical protein
MSERLMKILMLLSLLLILSITLVTFGIAYAGGVKGLGLVGVSFFFTAGVVVILAQLIPAEILLASFIGTTFGFLRKRGTPLQAAI